MKSYKSLFSLIFILFTTNSFVQPPTRQYVKFEYPAGGSKPYPVIILYMDGTVVTEEIKFYTKTISVSPDVFLQVKKNVVQLLDVYPWATKDTSILYPLQIMIVNGDEIGIFNTSYYNRMRQLFNAISGLIPNQRDRNVIVDRFENILSRIRHDKYFE